MAVWREVKESCEEAHELFERHYSYKPRGRLRRKRAFGPGRKIVLLTPGNDAVFVWLWQELGPLRRRPYCMLFRNEGGALSSALILAAEAFVFAAGWDTSQPAITFVDGREVRGDGACFKRAGWIKQRRRSASRGLIVLTKELLPPA